jgi:hypothetical protein
MSGSGFKNVIDGVEHFAQHELEALEVLLGKAKAEAIVLLGASITAVKNDIETKGPLFVKSLFADMAAAALAAKAAGKSPSEAGKAALAAAGTDVVADAVEIGKDAVEAAKDKLSDDAAHALATSAVAAPA